MPVQQVKQSTTATEFLQWIEFLNDQETQPPTRLEHYLMQIAAEIRLSRYDKARKKKRVTLKDFFLLFKYNASTDSRVTPMSEEEVEARKQEASRRSKSAWFAALGIKP